MRILVTGGAGFVGSSLGLLYAELPGAEVVAFDKLRRRGSERNLSRLKKAGIDFIHGDIRSLSDLNEIPGGFDLILECSAEPSVHAGTNGAPDYLLQTNLQGTLNCLEFCRNRGGKFLFLSTSRVYSLKPLRDLPLEEGETSLVLSGKKDLPGLTEKGITENFAVDTARSLYGATKLASEYFVQEYAHTLGVEALVNRCGVIAGPGQFGKVDQGVFTLWVAAHHLGKSLNYTGFGGTGKQVRDILHPRDLFDLIQKQWSSSFAWDGSVFNVGGGTVNATSLLEYTSLCEKVVGKSIEISPRPETNAMDVPFYVTDHSKVSQLYGWTPSVGLETIVSEISDWLLGPDEGLTLFA